jgi:uncharacterized protein YacL
MFIVLRIIFIFSSMLLSFSFFSGYPFNTLMIVTGVTGILSLLIIIIIEYTSHTISARLVLSGIIGLVFGLLIGNLISSGFSVLNSGIIKKYLPIIIPLTNHIFGFAIMMFFIINNDRIEFLNKLLPENLSDSGNGVSYKILDTSVIIDGRIADLYDTNFLEGILVIPNFVLLELQTIADSADSIKRNRGRRGLDILNKMQKDKSIMVKITDIDFKDISEVDTKLVKLAKVMKAKVVTNDFNLNKVAEFHGVSVLNLNQLSNALKPVVLAGEILKVSLLKEGKDQNQAIGYLDDGTMIVVENGRKKLHKDADVIVTSVLQTAAGKMIFAKLK